MIRALYLTVSSHTCPDSKVPGANMGPIWGIQDPGGPHGLCFRGMNQTNSVLAPLTVQLHWKCLMFLIKTAPECFIIWVLQHLLGDNEFIDNLTDSDVAAEN